MVMSVSKKILDTLSRVINVSRRVLSAFWRALGVSKGYWATLVGC